MNKYKTLCSKLKIDYKKDLIITLSIIVALLIGFIIMIIIKNIMLAMVFLIMSILYFVIHLSSLNNQLKKLTYAKEIAFNGFYRYVITLLKNDHILYLALQASLEYADEVILDDINELILDVENDTSLQPFLKFMGNFEDETIKQMIVLLYKCQEVGIIDDVIENINECIVNLQDTSINKYIIKEAKSIEKYQMVPIILSALALVIISIFVFSIIGNSNYV